MEDAQLTVADLASLRSLLEAACNRGAFKAQEMTSVGAVYDKLSRFLDLAAQAAEQQAQGDQNA